MSKKENIFEKTAKLLKENSLTLDVLTPDVIEEIQRMTKSHTDNSVTNLYEQEEPEFDEFSDEEKREIDQEHVDMTPFKPMEVKILKTLHKNLDRSELQKLSTDTPEAYGGLDKKFWDIMKLFGISVGTTEENTRVSRYAKWALDNWNEEGDYNIEDPIKVPLKWYSVERDESGSQVEYKSGEAEVLGFDEDDAVERADYDFYSWGGEMETMDYGDYESYDSEITSSEFIRIDENISSQITENDLRTKALISIGGIQRDKVTTPKFIKNIFNSSGHEAKSSGVEPEDGGEWNRFYTPGTNIDLNSDVQRVRDRIRFEEYGEMFQQGIEGRGFAFEGMLAGLFNGEPMEAGGKEDIKVGNEYYSIKQSNPGDAWDTGSLMVGFNFAVENMVRDGFSEEEIPPTPIDLMVAGEDYIGYKAQMLTESFKSTNGQPLQWIFAHVLNDKQIEYEVLDSEELISAILSSDCSQGTRSQACAVGRSRKGDTGIRIKSRFVLGNSSMITFPEVTEDEIKSIIYDPEGDRVEDKIRRIFKDPNKVSQYTVEYIRDNPQEFLASVNNLLPNLTTEEKNIAYNLLMEESDVFGQGLKDPIKPEDFEGTEEEWEELVGNVEDDGKDYEEDVEIYTGGKTNPERGFVAPSKEVTNNVCKVEGFCQEQGPITFGQLKALVEAATTKRIGADIGRGVFKSLWRIIPFFIPQILLAAVGVTVTRAFNKIITPALKDTGGYKSWWGKVVLKAMDIAEGDYIPDVALGDDPLSKVFFVSDGLMSMIKDKYKLKFARYVAEYASTRPDNEPVPDWFVENLLRDYLNQKFLLSPPLPVKIDIETKEQIEESKNPFGLLGDDWKDQILKHEENLSKNELKYKKLADNFDGMNVTIPVDIHDGEEPVIGTTDITFTIVKPYIFQGLRGDFFDNMTPRNPDVSYHGMEDENNPIPTVIKYDLVFTDVEPGSLLEKLLDENSIEGREGLDARERLMEILMQEGYSINESLMKDYFKLYGITVGRMGNMYDSDGFHSQLEYEKRQLEEQTGWDMPYSTRRDNWQEDKPLSQNTHNDSKLTILPDTLWKYLDSTHREKILKEISPTLDCIEYSCYDGWKDDPDNEWEDILDVDADDMAQAACEECGDELNSELEKIDRDLVKLGFAKEHDGEGYDGKHRKTWLEKPFPYSYSLWVDGLVKEINPRFYVDDNDDVSYIEDRMMNQQGLNEHNQNTLNPELKVDDIVRVIDVDGEHGRMPKRFGIYRVVRVGNAYPLMTMRNRGHDTYYDIVDYPSSSTQFSELDVKSLYRGDNWIKDNRVIKEHKDTKLNPDLMMGDEIMVVSTEGIHDFGVPELYEPYVVVGIKHGTTMMKGGKELEDSQYYQVEPIGMTDEERTGAMLAGGGRRRPLYIFHRKDQWILRKGFRRGEHLTEDDSLNDLVYIDEPKTKHIRRMSKDLGSLEGFPIGKYKNMPPPENESDTTEEEINHLETIPIDSDLVNSADDLDRHFKKFLDSKGLEYPKEELKKVIQGVRAIILQLKYHYNRPRPFQIAQAKGLKLDSESLKSASTPSYPSGHAAQGRFIGRYLADLHPEYGNELREIGDDIAFSRNMAKVHYPSDSEFGKALGDEMYDYVYQEDMEPVLQEQYDMVKPLDAKKRDTTSQLFRILDDNFTIQSHPRGEITYDDKQMALYSYANDMFVPISALYDSIEGMTEAGLPKEDIEIFIDIVTDWVNSRMVSKPQLYEQLMDIDKEENSPDLKVGDRIYVWDIVPDPQPPGGHDSDLELPTTSIAVVTDGPFTDRDEESFRGGIEYEVRDEMSGESYGLYGGTPVEDQMSTRFSTEYVPITYEDRDKWVLLPAKTLREEKRFTVQKVKRRKINEALEPEWSIRRGMPKDLHMPYAPKSGEQNVAFNDYLVKNSPFNYDGLDYYLSAVPGLGDNTARIDLFIPKLDKGDDADKIWSKDNLNINNSHFPKQTQRYNNEYTQRLSKLGDKMKELGKLFSIDITIINRNINKPWSRIPDSYGNENIRPGDKVPYHTPEIV